MLQGESVLIGAASAVSAELGGRIDAEALLLGALRGADEHSVARRALTATGVTLGSLEAERRSRSMDADPDDEADGRRVGDDARWLAAAAAGYALARGRERPAATDVLIVLLWGDPTDGLRLDLEDAGADPGTVVATLQRSGVALPTATLPRWVEVEAGPYVVFPSAHLERVIRHAGARLGDEHEWGWNLDVDADTAWVQGEAGADLPALVREVLDDASFDIRPYERPTMRVDARRVEGRGGAIVSP